MTFTLRRIAPLAVVATLALGQAWAQEPVKVEGAWARASVPGQTASGAFMRLTATQAMRLVGLESPAAGVAEIHEMQLDNGVMKMRALPELALAARQAVELKPGGYHVMLMDLKAPLQAGSQISLTLVLRDAQGAEQRQTLPLPVRAAAPAAAKAEGSGHGAHSGHHH